MTDKKTEDTSEKKFGLKNENVSIEININDKSGTSESKMKIGVESTEKIKEKAKEVLENVREKEKEIDLLEVTGNVANSVKKASGQLFTFLWRILKIVFIVLGRLIMFGFNSWKFAAIIAVITIGAAYGLMKTSEPYYHSDAYGISRITGSQEVIQIINSISIPNDKLNIALKNDLNLPPEVYNNVMSIKASWLVDENDDGIADFVDYDNDYEFNLEKDSMARRMTDRFNVRLTLKNQTVTNEVQIALENYLDNHPFISDLNNSRLSQLQGMINVYENQASVFDSLQNFEYFKEDDKNAVQSLKIGEFELLGQAEQQKDKRLYHEDIIALKGNVISNEALIQYTKDPIVFVGNFTNTTARANSLVFYGKRMVLAIIPLALLLFVVMRRKEFENIFRIDNLLEN